MIEFLLFCSISLVDAQIHYESTEEFIPLSVGNYWLFYRRSGFENDYYVKFEIIKARSIKKVKWYILNEFPNPGIFDDRNCLNVYLRYNDYGDLLTLNENNEEVIIIPLDTINSLERKQEINGDVSKKGPLFYPCDPSTSIFFQAVFNKYTIDAWLIEDEYFKPRDLNECFCLGNNAIYWIRDYLCICPDFGFIFGIWNDKYEYSIGELDLVEAKISGVYYYNDIMKYTAPPFTWLDLKKGK